MAGTQLFKASAVYQDREGKGRVGERKRGGVRRDGESQRGPLSWGLWAVVQGQNLA